jgi:hypothetical protein
MIEKRIRTTNGKLVIKMPSLLNEISLGQMMAMQEKEHLNDLDAISILTGIEVDKLNTVQRYDDLEVLNEYVYSLSEQIRLLYAYDKIPKRITFYPDSKPVSINVINNLSVEPAGAFMAVREIISEEIRSFIKKYGEENWQETFNPSLKACCMVLAHYFFCRVTGKKYNEYEADAFYNEVKQLKVTEALPVARHFFTCYPNLLKRKTGFWHQLQLLWSKRQAYNHLKNLNISIP